jgi:hypothetical protein
MCSIFEIKMDFTKKARLVAGGHRTTPPTSMTYSSVVSRESVRIAFLIAAPNDLDVIMSDVGNAYLNAKTTEKVYGIAGVEFGDADVGKNCTVVRALYGLKMSGAAWRAHFAADLRDMGFSSTLADPDVWYRPATKADGTEYYEYALVYVDDQLTVSDNPKAITDKLQDAYKYRLKDVGPPTKYLVAKMGPHVGERGVGERLIKCGPCRNGRNVQLLPTWFCSHRTYTRSIAARCSLEGMAQGK